MAKRKLQKFQQLKTFPNVYQENKEEESRDQLEMILKSKKKVILELGCGKGTYTLELARANPNSLFIGIDLKGARLWKAAKTALEEKINNAFFIRTDVRNILDFFLPQSINEIWLTFPGPFPKKRHIKHRMTHPDFLKIYKKILKPGGFVHLKTDSDSMFTFTLESLQEAKVKVITKIVDIYAEKNLDPKLKIQTTFEKKHLDDGKIIKYLKFRF